MKILLSFALAFFALPAGAQTQTPPPQTPAVTVITSPGPAAAPVNIEILLDASGSMNSLVGSESQMDIAKKAIKQTLSTIPPNVPVAFRAFAHRIPKADKEASCKDTELLVPFQPLNVSVLNAAVDSMRPNGYTPLAHALRTAASDFLGKESQYVIILLSDGEETCGGDPIAEARNLLTQGFKVVINTIGFRVDEKTRAQLAALSSATGGNYYDANDTVSLTQNLTQAAQKALLIEKPRVVMDARGQEIRGGNQYQDAVALKPNVEYRLDHHQRKDEFDYFYVDLKRGQFLTTTIATTDKGIRITEADKAEETDEPYAGFSIQDSTFQEVGRELIYGKKHGKEERLIVAKKDERFYILIGTYTPMHKNSPFMIAVKDHFDAGSGRDAGDSIENPIEIAVQNYPENSLFFRDDDDYFKVNVKAGQAYSFVATPQTMELDISLEVFDQDRINLGHQSSPNRGAAARFENIQPQRDGALYLHVSGSYHEQPEGYSLAVTATPAGNIPPPETHVAPPPLVPEVENKTVTKKAATSATDAQKDHRRFIFTLKALGISVAINFILAGIIYVMTKKRRKK